MITRQSWEGRLAPTFKTLLQSVNEGHGRTEMLASTREEAVERWNAVPLGDECTLEVMEEGMALLFGHERL